MAAVGAAMIMNEHVEHINVASLASDGANARLGAILLRRDARIKSIAYIPTGADNALSAGTAITSASYRRITIVNGGTAGTGTTVLASINNTASVASFGTSGGSLTGTAVSQVSAASGEVLVLSQATVGAATANGTTMAAGVISITYETL
jgi:hypothetical protein